MPLKFPLRALGPSLALLLAPMAMAQLYTEQAALRGDPVSDQSFGLEVAASGDTIVASTPGQPRTPKSAFVFVRGGSGWTLQQKLPLSWTTVAVDGDTLVSGDTIYARSGGTWTAQATMVVEHPALAVQRDTVVAGYPFDRVQARGGVLVYVRNGSGWSQQAFLRPDTLAANSFLGSSIALDGDTLAAGTSNGGDAYVYVRSGSTWTLQQRITVGTGFVSVALEGDTLAVGDYANNRVVIFSRAGTTWTQAQELAEPGSAGGRFGASIALSGGILAVQASGVFYVYAHTSSGWVLGQTITKSNYGFGTKVALANHGKLLVMGNPADGTQATYSGIVEVYSVPPPPAPGSGWADADVGAVGIAGNSNASGGTVTVRGAGADIWNGADAFHYRSETLTGDGAIVARVTSTGGGHSWSKVGLMFREDVAAAARNVMTLVTPGNHIGMQARPDTADTTTFQDNGWSGTPIWLMLARSGNIFGSYRSDDGNNWTLMSTTTVVMPATVHVGLAVSSHNAAALNTGTFDGVQVMGVTPPPPPVGPAAPGNLTGSLAASVDVQLQWTDNSSDENGFSLERSIGTGGGSYSVITNLATNTTTFTDRNLAGSTAYTYRLRAVRGSDYSTYSNTFTITTQSAPPSELTGVGIGGGSGTSSASGGVTTIDARGSDFWGNADSGYFLNRAISGDFDLRARIDNLQNTHPWAKAGVMVRESTEAGARNVLALITADNASGFQVRSAAGGDTTFTAGAWLRAPYWTRVVRTGNLFQGYLSPDGTNWTLVGSVTLALPAQVLAGIAVSSHTSDTSCRVIASQLSFGSGPPPPPPPSDWAQTNWPEVAGSATMNSTGATVTARSGDFWYSVDYGMFVYRTWAGDGEVKVRVASMSDGHPWSKAGLMIRSSADRSAGNAFIAMTPHNGVIYQFRWGLNTDTGVAQQSWLPGAPCWLKLTRAGANFTAAFSLDGANWTSLGTTQVAVSGEILVGFAVSSHDTGATTTAVFSDYSGP